MNIQHPDIVVRYVRTKNKTRKIVTYRSDECELRKKHIVFQKFITDNFVPSIFSKGYVKHRSIYHNALSHLYNDYFIILDIKDFFSHICHKQLSDKLLYELNKKQLNQINKRECNELIDACSISSRGLPLGFITSPILSNIYLKEFDNIFYGKLKALQLDNIIYTRYADDLIISFKTSEIEKLPDVDANIQTLVENLLRRYGLQINTHKSRSYNLNTSNHVRITGVNIIKSIDGKRRLSVGKSLKNELYWNAINIIQNTNRDSDNIQKIKGMQSFVLSIEKCGYENCYSKAMVDKLHLLGFSSLKELIDSL